MGGACGDRTRALTLRTGARAPALLPRGQHVHAYIDGELMGMFDSAQGTLTGVKPGKHTLELRVVTADHNTELDAIDKVEFTVR